jgi:peptidoglycan/LPS O-acetylase OafA/YrhL
LPSSVKHMIDLKPRSLLILAVALLVPAAASVWLMAVPQTMTSSTYSMGAILLMALAGGALVSHRRRLSDQTVASSAPPRSTATP